MSTDTRFFSPQGVEGRRVFLASGEVAVCAYERPVYWERGGVSISVFPDTSAAFVDLDTDGTLTVEHSLSIDGDLWTSDLSSPYAASAEIREQGRHSRVRITAVDTSGNFELLGTVGVKIELS